MSKSKKDKAAGLEKHKQLQREKEMKRKQKKQVHFLKAYKRSSWKTRV